MKQKIKRIFLAALLCMTVILGTLTTAYAAKTVSSIFHSAARRSSSANRFRRSLSFRVSA